MADLVNNNNNREREVEEENDNAVVEEEDTGAHIAPIVRLEEVAVTTGEEDEEPLLELKSKLYRFDKDGNQWKERGTGTIKFLEHRDSGRVRVVMRQSKTLKICANHLITSGMSVQEHAGNEKSCVWHAADYADGELKDEMFCIRFPLIENCRMFMKMFQEIADAQIPPAEDIPEAPDAAPPAEDTPEASGAAPPAEDTPEASDAAEALERLTVEDSEASPAKEDEVKVDEKKTGTTEASSSSSA